MTGAELRLADLLAQPDLGLQLVTRASTQVRVRGAHAIEIADPSHWLRPGWLMLTVGTRFADPRTPEWAARDLIRELDEAGIAGLGFGVGVLLDSVPRELVEEANARAFPIVTIPYEVPFLQVTAFVNQSLLSTDLYLLKRTISMQNHLIESLTEERPEQALVDRLGNLLKAAIVLYDAGGDIVASTGPVPRAAVWDEISSKPATPQRFQVGRWSVASTPITAEGEVQWLTIATRRSGGPEDLAREALQVTERLLAALSHSREVSRLEKRLRAAEVLDGLLDETAVDTSRTWDRLVGFGFPLREPVRVLVITQPQWEGPGGADVDRGAVFRALELASAQLHLPLLVTTRPPRLVGLCPADDDRIDAVVERTVAGCRVGLSAALDGLAQCPQGLRDAELALLTALRRSRRLPSLLRFEHVDFAEWLLAARPSDQVAAKAAHVLGPVADNPLLVEALVVYLRYDLDIRAAAQALHLHPNSVRYRLHRAERLLGHPVGSPATLTNLYLALHHRLQY